MGGGTEAQPLQSPGCAWRPPRPAEVKDISSGLGEERFVEMRKDATAVS